MQLGRSRDATTTPEPDDMRALTSAARHRGKPPVFGVMKRMGGAAAGNFLTLCDDRLVSSVITSGQILPAGG
jgi:hypothetical protein